MGELKQNEDKDVVKSLSNEEDEGDVITFGEYLNDLRQKRQELVNRYYSISMRIEDLQRRMEEMNGMMEGITDELKRLDVVLDTLEKINFSDGNK